MFRFLRWFFYPFLSCGFVLLVVIGVIGIIALIIGATQ